MTAPAFTPGYWTRKGTTIEAHDPATGETLEVAQVLEDGDPKYAAQTIADANLLAASKSLYLAAKAAAEWHEAALRGKTSTVSAFDVADVLAGALAQAEGRR